MNKKFLFLVNPISGAVRKTGVIDLIKKIGAEQKLPFHICDTDPTGVYADARSIILDEGITHVGVVGGDGSVNQAVNALKELPVNFGIIPMGSGNGLAYTARIPKDPAAAVALLINGTASSVDAFMVNGQFACMLSGLGFDAHVAHEFANRASRGLLTYTRETLLHYFKAGTYSFDITIDGFSFSTDAFFISIANSNQFGNKVTIAPHASLNDGLLDIVIVQKMNKALLPFAVLQQLRGANKAQVLTADALRQNILYFQARSLQLMNNSNAPLHIDGEPRQSADAFTVEVIPSCFELIQPA